ncbi:NAD(P)-dependent oxidoreductase [Candidatus Uabimicrobium amorphum]|uniref:2-hydroxyacid dehydrogenase n=1 Tax=Uabimicrobium amorphum TaxID=2596890 RepID=A0A5S9ITE0_UABAM|nr:NAD(P)-dependent oxidoreductase [Candidatus Uabimicrobium amorphum]BBM87286.1 2-hydroxyacid dehydrogenase [Candidatus Uabimicrobium amorphum]
MILIYENIGVSIQCINELIQQYKIDLEVVQKNDAYDKEKVKVIVTVNHKMDMDVLSSYPNLEMIAVSFTGYDSVCEGYCKKNGIAVYNAAGYSTDSVAELAVSLAKAVLRKIPELSNKMNDGKWQPVVGRELAGKTVGIIGVGAIGLRTAEIFKAYKCNIIAYSNTKPHDFLSLGKYVAWDELFSTSDIVTLHWPLNDETKGKVASREFQLMKETSIIINTARGPIICRDSLVEALKTNMIYGAGLDVYSSEPPNDSELEKLSNAVLTPHIAFRTEEALQRKADITIKNIRNYLTEQSNINRVI